MTICVTSPETYLALIANQRVEDPLPPMRRGPAVYLPDGTDTRDIDLAWLRRHVNLDQAAEVWMDTYPTLNNRCRGPWDGPRHAPGTWAFDPRDSTFEVLLEFDPHTLLNNEDEREGRMLESFPVYVEWARQGFVPPPITTYRATNTGAIISANRRRMLAARDAGRRILGWFSESSHISEAWRLPTGTHYGDTLERLAMKERYAWHIAEYERRLSADAEIAWTR